MEYITVKELFKITKGKKVEEIDYENENSIRYIQIDDLRNNNNIKHCENINKYVIAKKEDIIIAWDGANAGTIGFGIEGAIGSTLAILRKENKEMDTEFCGLFLRSKSAYLREKCTGATIPHIQRTALEDIKIPKISLNKQIEIKNIINKAQELIDKRKEQIEALDELVKSKFIEMFGELKTNENNFDIVDLEYLTTKITDGVHSKPEYTSEGVEFISVKDINKGKLNFDECKYISQEAHERYIKRCRPEIGDVLYTKVGATYGIPAVVDTEREFSLYVSVALLKLKKDIVNPIYIKEALRSVDVKRQADRQVKGIGVPDLHLIEIKKFKVFNPPIELQNQFADFVKQVDKLKFEMEKSLKELEDNFNSLMQKAFKGELFN